MIVLTRDELSRCQIGTLNVKRGQNIKYLPFAFTELGVAMLSSVLKTPSAIKVNRDIMRAFVALRHIAEMPNTDDRLKKIEVEIISGVPMEYPPNAKHNPVMNPTVKLPINGVDFNLYA